MKKFCLLVGAGAIAASMICVFSCAPKMTDYAHNGSVKLTLDYKDKDFYKDGIAEVEVSSFIDGDTTHFVMKNSTNDTVIKSRYYGIDTPESTGAIQPYGKKASNFTKKTLSEAKTIVVSSPAFTYQAPQTDSTGSRYLSLVWYSTKENASYDELTLLNLEIVQNGYSWVKSIDKIPAYQDIFIAAEDQAKEFKLNLFSGEDDDEYNYGDYTATSIAEINSEIITYLKDDTKTYVNAYNGAKVRITGTVSGSSNGTLYLQSYDPTTEKYSGINVYCGMGSIPSKYRTVGNVLTISGTACDSENFGFQVSGVTFQTTRYKGGNTDAKVEYYAEDGSYDSVDGEDDVHEIYADPMYRIHTFEHSTIASLPKDSFEELFSPVEVEEEFEVTGGYDSTSYDYIFTLYGKDSSGNRAPFNIYCPIYYYPDQEGSPNLIYKSYQDFVGKKVKVKGVYTYHVSTSKNLSYNITLRSSDDMVIVG